MLQPFKKVFTELDGSNLSLLDDIYSPEVQFLDPFHTINGRDRLHEYFEKLYANVEHCRFTFDREMETESQATIIWTMNFKHRRMPRAIDVHGASYLEFGEKIDYHRDFFDAGELLYEHLPLIGGAVRFVKKRV